MASVRLFGTDGLLTINIHFVTWFPLFVLIGLLIDIVHLRALSKC